MSVNMEDYFKYRNNLLADLKKFLGVKNLRYENINEAGHAVAAYWEKLLPLDEEELNEFYDTCDDYIYENSYWNVGRSCRMKARKILKILDEFNINTITEIGCGIGTDAICLAAIGKKVTVMEARDLSFRFFLWRCKQHNISIPVNNTGLPMHQDCVMFFDVIEHIHNPFQFMGWVAGAKPKSILLTQAFRVHEERMGGHPQHFDYSYSKVEKVLLDNGYIKQKLAMAYPPRFYLRKEISE